MVEASFVKNSVVKARGPIICGFLGAYTARKAGVFSVSYNVRESTPEPDQAQLTANFLRNLDPKYTPV